MACDCEGYEREKKTDLVAEDFSFASLNEEWRETGKVPEERRDVGVGEVLVNSLWPEKALDGVEVVVCLRLGEIIEGPVRGPRLARPRKVQ